VHIDIVEARSARIRPVGQMRHGVVEIGSSIDRVGGKQPLPGPRPLGNGCEGDLGAWQPPAGKRVLADTVRIGDLLPGRQRHPVEHLLELDGGLPPPRLDQRGRDIAQIETADRGLRQAAATDPALGARRFAQKSVVEDVERVDKCAERGPGA
jgi:hypothetical protein